MNKKYLLAFLLLIGIASAQNFPQYLTNSSVNIQMACTQNGADCVAASCDFTSFYPNSTLFKNHAPMTVSGTNPWNYTLSSPVQGVYISYGTCFVGAANASTDLTFELVDTFTVFNSTTITTVNNVTLNGNELVPLSTLPSESICVGDQLFTTQERQQCANGACVNISVNNSIMCQFGCSADQQPNACNPSPSQAGLIFFGAIFIIICVSIFGITKLMKR